VEAVNRPTLGIMTLYLKDNKLEEIDYFRKLTLIGNKLNIRVIVFTPEDLHSDKKLVSALQYEPSKAKWSTSWRPIPDLIYDRCRYQPNYRFTLLRKFRAAYPQLTYLNRPIGHKWTVHQSLYKNSSIRPFLPETTQFHKPSDLIPFLQKYNIVYMKPSDGTGGRGILCIRRLVNNQYLVQGRDRNRKIIQPLKMRAEQIATKFQSWGFKDHYLIQQGIPLALPDGRVHDYRLLIQKNGEGNWEITGCAGRVGPLRSITSNLHGGGRAMPMAKLLQSRFTSSEKINEISESMDQLSYLVAAHLEKQYGRLCELALDIAVSPSGHVWLLEVNPKPAREVFIRIKEFETYEKAIRRPLEYALWLHNQNQLEQD
jgi:glutathione synthase/RimK-type ligase-like ATP-grasp enzyme